MIFEIILLLILVIGFFVLNRVYKSIKENMECLAIHITEKHDLLVNTIQSASKAIQSGQEYIRKDIINSTDMMYIVMNKATETITNIESRQLTHKKFSSDKNFVIENKLDEILSYTKQTAHTVNEKVPVAIVDDGPSINAIRVKAIPKEPENGSLDDFSTECKEAATESCEQPQTAIDDNIMEYKMPPVRKRKPKRK